MQEELVLKYKRQSILIVLFFYFSMGLFSDVVHIMTNISWKADITGTVVMCVIGAFWHSDFAFGPLWRRLIGLSDETYNDGKSTNLRLLHIPVAFLITANISAFCKHFEYHTAAKGFLIGYDLGLIVCLFLAVQHIYAQRSLSLYAISA